MKTNRSAAIVTLIALSSLIGCGLFSCKKTYHYPDSPVTNYYMPLAIGKYAIYQLDSLTFYYYGQLDTITHYLAKDSVEDSITDNEGRPGWKVVRYLSDLTGQSWTPTLTLTVTPSTSKVEVVENNMRFIKLAFPVDEGYTWSGNSYLAYDPYQDFFDYSDGSHKDLNSWTYTYQNVNKPYTAGSTTYDSTATILLAADSVNVPVTIDTIFGSINYWQETYAKGIGLVHRRTAMWEYQPAVPSSSQSAYKLGFECSFTLLSHN